MRFLTGLSCLLTLLSACGPKIIPDDIKSKIDPALAFEDLVGQAETHIGKTILLGGEIIETHVYEEGSEIEILQKPLGPGQAPRHTDASQGRFFVSDTGFLDPEVFKSGRRITVVGKIKGSQARTIGETTKSYPRLEKEHLHLWPSGTVYRDDDNPRVYFGFGAIFSN